jgi:hypothetical protein
MVENVWYDYDAAKHVIEKYIAIVVRCSCGDYHISNIAAAIADVNHNGMDTTHATD